MKPSQVLKTVVAAAALIAGASASAQTWVAESGTGKLTFNTGLLSIFKSASITVSSDAPATTFGDAKNAVAGVIVQADPSTMKLAPDNNVLGASFLGGVNLTIAGNSDYGNSLTPITITLKNLSFTTSDGATKGYLYADFVGNGVNTTHTLLGIANTLVPSPARVTGPVLTVSGPSLLLSTEAKDVLGKGLDLNETGLDVLTGVKNLGAFEVTGKFAAAVPEPSTYAMLGLGLVGLALAGRRSRKAATAA